MKKKISKSLLMTALIAGLCIGGVQSAFAADDLNTFALDEYIVTATRTEKNLLKVPASASVITAKEIKERNIKSLDEALKTQTGVLSSSALIGVYGNVQMRGFTSDNILVMYDGQPINNAWSGDANINSIPIESVERIEIVRGSASSLYGGKAVGGVINIISKDIGNKKMVGNAIISYGSHDTWKKAISLK